ncbi:hypothetical protein J437_LFUL013466 [Ladona fulva]|uniref:Transposable element P transposase n=1 Tax=Ladona fulva TaxID=123851 RepID=A0A8K0P750_LADFU|nr:hypothetical protein J437_LFUL013466 [Ladona fulva]
MSNLLSVTSERPFFTVEGEDVCYIFDVPHLIKSFRNNFLKHSFKYDGNVASWSDISAMYQHDKKFNLRLLSKLTDAHVNPNCFQKMKVKLATQVISQTVASCIRTYVSLGKLKKDSLATASLISEMDKLFDILNSSKKENANAKCYNRAWMGADYQTQFLRAALGLVSSISVVNNKGKDVTKTMKFLHGFEVTINSITFLWGMLKKRGFTFLLIRRLNQDGLENFFSSLRKVSGNARNPTPIQVQRGFKKVFVLGFFEQVPHTNCEPDMDTILEQIGRTRNAAGTTSKEIQRKGTTPLLVYTTSYKTDLPAKNALYYVSGYLAKTCLTRHCCDQCQKMLNCNSELGDYSLFTHYKAYKNHFSDVFGNLKAPHVNFLSYVSALEDIFVENLDKMVLRPSVGLSLVNLMAKSINFCPPCQNFDVIYLLKLFVRMRIYYTLKYTNRDLRSTLTAKTQKLKFVQHL